MADHGKAKKAVLEALGDAANTIDEPIVEYIINILSDFHSSEPGVLQETIAPLLSDAIGDEEQTRSICEKMEELMFGSEKRSNGAEEPLKLLTAPVNLAEGVEEVEATMSFFVYVPKIERGARARGEIPKPVINAEVDNSEEARVRRAQIEARERQKQEKSRIKKELANARRDAPVVASRNKAARIQSRDIKLEGFDVSLAGKVLIKEASIGLNFGRRYGLVGRNGAGKTTLLKHIAGREISGIPGHVQILHVEQEAIGDDTTVIESVLAADVERASLLKEEKEILDSKKEGNDARLAAIYARLQEIDADAAEARASAILAGLGFSATAQKRPTKEFSGGWRMRMALSRALFCEPDLLLLDEPTNMLDIQAVLWLEDYLSAWPTTLLVVSHDRNFLNHVATDIIHLSQLQLESYHGNYETFEQTRMEKMKNQKKAVEAQDRQKQHVQKFIDRFRYNAKRASLVQSRIKMLSKMEVIPALIEDPTCSFSFPDPEELAPPLIQFDEMSFSYDKSKMGRGPQEIFSKVTFSLDMDSRVALVGANGQGKTTLLKLITGELKNQLGTVFIHRRIRFATFSQHHVDQLNMSLSPLEFFTQNFPGKEPQEYRSHLGRYGISGDLALQSIDTLSGGQKSRVVFALMGWIKPHFLILDEPTNHLDVETVEILALALNSYSGGLVLVTHDERLITSVCSELWVVHNGSVRRHDGDFNSYKQSILSEFK